MLGCEGECNAERCATSAMNTTLNLGAVLCTQAYRIFFSIL